MRHLVILSVITGFVGVPMLSNFPAPAGNGVWAQLCSGQPPVWIDLGPRNSDDNKDKPTSPIHSKACHAVCCKRDDGLMDDTDCGGDDALT